MEGLTSVEDQTIWLTLMEHWEGKTLLGLQLETLPRYWATRLESRLSVGSFASPSVLLTPPKTPTLKSNSTIIHSTPSLLDCISTSDRPSRESLERRTERTAHEIKDLLRACGGRIRLAPSWLIVATLYVERLVASQSATALTMSPSLLAFGCVLTANKFLEDAPYANRSWSDLAGMPLSKVNRCELVVLTALQHDLQVPPSTFRQWTVRLARQLVWVKLGSQKASPPPTDASAAANSNRPANERDDRGPAP